MCTIPLNLLMLLPLAVCLPTSDRISPLKVISNSIYEAINRASDNSSMEVVSNANVKCATQQMLEAGMLYKVYYGYEEKLCEASIWTQPFLNSHKKVSVSCKTDTTPGFEGMRYCVKQKDGFRGNRNFQENNDVVSMEKDNKGYDALVKQQFDEFIKAYDRDYSETATPDTYRQRYQIFERNLKFVKKLNDMRDGAVYGINQFMDYSNEEYRKYLAPGFTKPLFPIRNADLSDLNTKDIPESVDWRKKGAVTRVKNQGKCGSCWAFATTGNVEGQWFLKHGKLYSLSEQQLVDCDSFAHGCRGGTALSAFLSINLFGGLEVEEDYPYVAKKQRCHLNESKFKVHVNSSIVLPINERQLAAWLAKNGPIATSLNASALMFYWGGIARPKNTVCNPAHPDHAVLIVGYGTEKGTPYWIIKNSWGARFGEKGYFRVHRGSGSCGLNLYASSAVVN